MHCIMNDCTMIINNFQSTGSSPLHDEPLSPSAVSLLLLCARPWWLGHQMHPGRLRVRLGLHDYCADGMLCTSLSHAPEGPDICVGRTCHTQARAEDFSETLAFVRLLNALWKASGSSIHDAGRPYAHFTQYVLHTILAPINQRRYK